MATLETRIARLERQLAFSSGGAIASIDDRVRQLEHFVRGGDGAHIEHTDSWNPVLTGPSLGTGGKSGSYTFVGGPGVGDEGILSLTGAFTITGGSMPANASFDLPAGFAYSGNASVWTRFGTALYRIGVTYIGHLGRASNTTFDFMYSLRRTADDTILEANVGPSAPGTWANDGFARWEMTIQAVRT